VPTRPRVLLVDDHPGVVKALGRALSPECDVVGAIADGREVADAATRLQPVVIVVDLNLPNVNGLDVCRQITQNNPLVKVIVISAMADDDIQDEALAAGASGFFHKSALHELSFAIRRIWSERNQNEKGGP
jgi:DNA-binding NarL/FixJ family response regulator